MVDFALPDKEIPVNFITFPFCLGFWEVQSSSGIVICIPLDLEHIYFLLLLFNFFFLLFLDLICIYVVKCLILLKVMYKSVNSIKKST